MTTIRLMVEVDAQFTSGKFAARDEIAQQLADDIQDPGSVSVNEGEYDITNFEVSEMPDDYCDANVRKAIDALLDDLAKRATMFNTRQTVKRLRKLVGRE